MISTPFSNVNLRCVLEKGADSRNASYRKTTTIAMTIYFKFENYYYILEFVEQQMFLDGIAY